MSAQVRNGKRRGGVARNVLNLVILTASGFCVGLGVLVLVGWHIRNATLVQVLPDLVPMQYNTALGFLLFGVGLIALMRGRRRLSALAGALVATVGVLTLAEYIFALDLGIDQLLMEHYITVQTSSPGRMAPNTALSLLLGGAALLTLAWPAQRRQLSFLAGLLSSIVVALGAIAFFGYISGIETAYGWGEVTRMAVHTAVGFVGAGLGAFAFAWRAASAGEAIMPDWLPVPVGIGVLTLALSLWQAMAARELLLGEEAKSSLPELILIFGVFMAGVLALSVHLAQTARLRASQFRMANRELENAITKSKQAEQEIKRLFTLSSDLLCVAGYDGSFKRLNPAWQEVLGFTLEELRAQPYLEFVHPEDRAATLGEAEKIAGGARTIHFENRYRSKDGSYRWLQWTSHPVMEEQVIYAAARDVTDHREAQQALARKADELAAANQELEAFTYSVSHDLRAPLRHIDGFARILLEEHAGQLDGEGRHCLDRVCAGARQMGQLIDDLLAFSRVGRRELDLQVTGLNSLVQDVKAGLLAEAENRKVEWRIGQLPFVECDPALMKQVFANLLSNALKYTRPRECARIEVAQTKEKGRTAVFVRDNGVGFSMKHADKLFGVFQRLHRPEDFEGTGVGLATVQRIIHKHGGRVWAEAELNKGATFYFSLGQPGTGITETPDIQAVGGKP